MKCLVLDIGDPASMQPVQSVLSFLPFQRFISQKLATEAGVKVRLYELLNSFFYKYPELVNPITISETAKYTDLLEIIYGSLTGIAAEDKKTLWAFGMPVPGSVFYASEDFNTLIKKAYNGVKEADKVIMKKEQDKEKLSFIYSLILEKCYGFYSFMRDQMIYNLRSGEDHQKYYTINIDARFIEVSIEGELPDLNFEFIETNIRKENILEYLSEQLNLDNYKFSGFSIISLVDITSSYALQNIKNTILDNVSKPKYVYVPEIIQALKTIVGSTQIDFGFFPFIQLNKKLLLDQVNRSASILLNKTTDTASAALALPSLLKHFSEHPHPVIKRNLSAPDDTNASFAACVKQTGYRSFAVIPLFNNKELIGVLEAATMDENLLTLQLLAKLDPALPYIAQMVRSLINDFHEGISQVINNEFTSIQPSVRWKFEEAAIHYLGKKFNKEKAIIEPIIFKNVYPLYGAIDIRDSTVERNYAATKDFKEHFHLLLNSLQTLKENIDMPIIDEMLFESRKLRESLGEFLTAETEINLSHFFFTKVNPFMQQLSATYPVVAHIVDKYTSEVDATKGTIFKHRDLVENSITMINTSVSNYIEWMKEEVMKMYPSYFESFRTDGVEYDIYLGQSIAPGMSFNHLFLKNFRLLQLKSMAAIAKITHALLPLMEVTLETTQLIFVHNDAIDISFRNDERRFDVEGSYNIRYHIVKKRIDKILIKGTSERLTQPRKIAMVYSDKNVADQYDAYIRFLQEERILHDEVEYLELEEMQGVSGLRAIRVSVNVD